MSYQVLARKWRPDSFETLVGQAHVVKALTHALERKQLHHAYLFIGTRGIGKTTLGRILAKCLNCESGITSKPCNQCQSCIEIANCRFIDLIEIDAASRTKVEDTRELLENVPYSPTRGRFKVYFIDEAHMLSAHSFNALLKTLEEPPPHVKFFLATTDPKKLPITVLSRCLQFHLKCLSPEQIAGQLAYILQQEKISYEEEALSRLAYSADGSMRDALSLLDQAIAFSNGNVTINDVKLMLGTIEVNFIYLILEALISQQADILIATTQQLAEQSFDFANTLEELISLLHRIAIFQFVPNADLGASDQDKVAHFAKLISPQNLQLYYQIALIGRKDLPFAPTPRMGLEMTLLRMLAFRPQEWEANVAANLVGEPGVDSKPVKLEYDSEKKDPWPEILCHLNLSGITAAIANNCTLEKMDGDEVILNIDPVQSVLLNKKQEERLAQALTSYLKKTIHLTIKIGQPNMSTPTLQKQKAKPTARSAAEESIRQDPNIKNIIETFGAKILPETIATKDS